VSTRVVEVDLADRGYEVRVGTGVLASAGQSVRAIVGDDARRAFVVVDTGVPERFVLSLNEDLASHGFEVCIAEITPSEKIKSIETYHRLLVEIASSNHTRIDPVIALGGGVVGDLAGFVAASYLRGVAVIQCPSTLLSMVDASVGGKTGFNLRVPDPDGEATLLKNFVGAFHQPRLVIADIALLESLDPRHRRYGLAECIKHGMIGAGLGGGGHGGLLDWMIEHLDAISGFEPTTIEELVARNVALKAQVVAGDERESTSAKGGGRMLLNFGHTFGHAIETLSGVSPDPSDPGLSPLHHGEAVALGMVAACRVGAMLGLCDEALGHELVSMLDTVGLPTRVAGLPDSVEIVARMSRDKKAAGADLRVILPVGRGKCEIVRGVEPAVLAAGIDAIRA
jgi:3-dehydroquinate synthase